MPALGEFILRARASGLASAYRQVAWVEDGQDQQIDLTLGEPWELTGVATDSYGTPLGGFVTVSSFAGGDEVPLDSSGRFRFLNLPRGMAQVVVCWESEEGCTGDWVQLPQETSTRVDVGTLAFDVKRKLDVRVVDADGTTLDGIPLGAAAEGKDWITAFTSTISLGAGRYTIRARGVEASATIQVGREPLPSPLILVAKNVIQVRGRVTYEGSESPDLSELVYLVQGPTSIAARDAMTRGEQVPTSVETEYMDDGRWIARPISPDGTISFCVPRDWHEALVIVGAPAYGFSHSTLESEIATARVRTDGGQVEIRISPKSATGPRPALRVGDESDAAKRQR